MSKAFAPPDTLSKEDIRTVADVRRDIWTNGFKGMGFGGLAGYISHAGLQRLARGGAFGRTLAFNRNTAFVSILLGSTITAYVMAVTTGKNEVHRMHDVFQVGAKPRAAGDDVVA